MKDRLMKIKGRIRTIRRTHHPRGAGWLFNPQSGLWERRSRGRNMIVLAGLGMMAKSIQYGNADAGKTIRYMAVGTGYTAPAKAQTALVTELLRVAIDSWDNTDIASDPVVMIATYLFDTGEANDDLMEAGLFQESTGAPMFCRGLFGNGTITGASKADPCVITSTGHGLSDGDKVLIEAVGGMTELNGNAYFVDQLGPDTFALYTDEGLTVSVDSSAYTDYTTGGTWKLIIPKTSDDTLTVNYSLTFPAD